MSSCDCIPRVESSHGLEAKSFVFLVGLLALVFLAGCGRGSTTTSGGRGASVSATIKVGTAPSAIAVDSTTNKIYVTDFGTIPTGIPCSASGADLEAIDGATQSKTSVGFSSFPIDQVNATGMALNSISQKLYVQIIAYWNGIKRSDPCAPISTGIEVFDTTRSNRPMATSSPTIQWEWMLIH